MLVFIIVFIIVGMIIGFTNYDENTGYTIIIIISVLWAFIMGPWAIATFIELTIGYNFARHLRGAQ